MPTKLAGVFLLVAVLILGLVGGWWLWYAPNLSKTQFPQPRLAISTKFAAIQTDSANYRPPRPTHISLNTLFFGDVFWGRYIHEWAQASELKTAYPFSGLHTFDRASYDAWIGSLNCPITPEQLSASQQNTLLKFNCTPEYLPEAAKWFSAFNLANSHTDNMQEVDGFAQTRQRLTENGVQFFGHFNKAVENEICEVLSFRARSEFGQPVPELIQRKEYYIPVAICGYHNTFALPTDSQIAQITKYAQYFPTLVYAIQGPEYQTSADGLQRQYFRKMIDAGGDAVIGKGAHVVQDSESYRGKLIVYSMGNFIYDQQFSPDVRQGVAINVKLLLPYDENLEKWQDIAKSCAAFQDDCLQQAQALGLQKPKFKLYFDFIPTDNSGKLAKKGDDALRQKMRQRLNWDKTIAGLE